MSSVLFSSRLSPISVPSGTGSVVPTSSQNNDNNNNNNDIVDDKSIVEETAVMTITDTPTILTTTTLAKRDNNNDKTDNNINNNTNTGTTNKRKGRLRCLLGIGVPLLTFSLIGSVSYYFIFVHSNNNNKDNTTKRSTSNNEVQLNYNDTTIINLTEWEIFKSNDPFTGVTEATYKWSSSNKNNINRNNSGLSIDVINALDVKWHTVFDESINNWNTGNGGGSSNGGNKSKLLDSLTIIVTIPTKPDPDCFSIMNYIKVCNNNYGPTFWKSITKKLINSNNIIISATSRMNDYYIEQQEQEQQEQSLSSSSSSSSTNNTNSTTDNNNYNTSTNMTTVSTKSTVSTTYEKLYLMCHELGHSFGLIHTNETYDITIDTDTGFNSTNNSTNNSTTTGASSTKKVVRHSCMDLTMINYEKYSYPNKQNFISLKKLYGVVSNNNSTNNTIYGVDDEYIITDDTVSQYDDDQYSDDTTGTTGTTDNTNTPSLSPTTIVESDDGIDDSVISGGSDGDDTVAVTTPPNNNTTITRTRRRLQIVSSSVSSSVSSISLLSQQDHSKKNRMIRKLQQQTHQQQTQQQQTQNVVTTSSVIPTWIVDATNEIDAIFLSSHTTSSQHQRRLFSLLKQHKGWKLIQQNEYIQQHSFDIGNGYSIQVQLLLQ